jgi:SAM-dependent methyltransferase
MNPQIADWSAAVTTSLKTPADKEYYEIHCVRYRETINRVLATGLPRGTKILDIGCFPPYLFHVFSQAGFEMSGISSGHEPILLKNVVSLNIETDQLPYRENSFGAVFFFEVMEHLLFAPVAYFRKIRKILKNGGYLFLSTPNAVHIKNRLSVLMGKSTSFSLDQFPQPADWQQLYYRHNREYTGFEISTILQNSGFHDISVSYFNSYTPFRTKSTREKLPSRLVKIVGNFLSHLHPTLKDTIFTVARA